MVRSGTVPFIFRPNWTKIQITEPKKCKNHTICIDIFMTY